ncbi:MAG: DUF2231 domain-containing protein [Gammaproteobacteria bacterium]|nr:DUF2231 domain-containing protein [Gammaproteobacteria bacterium]
MIDISHIHPILVHFPVVLFTVSTLLSLVLWVRKANLADKGCLQLTMAVALGVGVMMAIAAAAFGDLALDAALDKGFDKAPLEEHEELAGITIVIHAVLAVILLAAMWKKIKLDGVKALVFVLGSIAGMAMLVTAAYHGGELVYKHGVNVEVVHPQGLSQATGGAS